MLFNSFAFLFAFLPVTLGLYYLFDRSQPIRTWFLVISSVIFYGYWDVRFVPLLTASVGVNWLLARAFIAYKKRAIVVAAIVINLAVLGLYKYLGFFSGILSSISGQKFPEMSLALPLGISFFTFHHIIYLVDLLRGNAPHYRLREYALYIVLFPQILAGPLVRHSEIVHQFRLSPWREGLAERLGRGTVLFVIGLAKKVLLADPLATSVIPVFEKAHTGALPSLAEAWGAAMAFTFQIYFDFSGYSDMAIGLALMLGFVLPLNFDAPYRATSIRDFWRRWHITLSRFLRDYLYIPLGGNRFGPARQVAGLLATMALGGLWHGAGWTFVAWGAAHGGALSIAALWRRFALPMPAAIGWVATFLFVSVTWVLFRAQSWAAVDAMFRAMFGAAPMGAFDGWPLILVAAAIAIYGRTSWTFSQNVEPRRWLAAGVALAGIALLFLLNGDTEYEFIYFKF